MHFENNEIYHVFNQGNNRQEIFFREENYLFFLDKMRQYLLPYVDLLAYCLMPNHFHWLFQVKVTVLEVDQASKQVIPVFLSEGKMRTSHSAAKIQYRSLNSSIGILLRSYTRAVNIQENRSGALFRPHTKAQSGWIDEFITIDRYRSGSHDFRAFPDDDYGYHCFNYIHQNPVKAQLCLHAEDWLFSSARDYAGLRNGTLCNQNLAKNLLLLP